MADVVLNEIHYAPDLKTEAVEFIELFNNGTEKQDLSGWRLSGAVDYSFPANTGIDANGYLVVAQDPAALLAKFGCEAIGPWAGRLSNDGETIRLRNAADDTIDKVDYQLGFPWPTTGDAPGYSIELINPAFDNDLGGNWRSATGSGNPAAGSALITAGSSWSYFRGTTEASSPTDAWRAVDFDDSSWLSGPGAIGYGESFITTPVDDMQNNCTTLFLRNTFTVSDPAAISELVLRAQYDDGFKLWINGTNVLNANVSNLEVPYTGTAQSSSREDYSYAEFNITSPAAFLQTGTNALAVQLLNANSSSSDLFWDAEMDATVGTPDHGPTPGTVNSVYADSAPPRIRQVDHSPNQPQTGEPVLITAKITDPDGVDSVQLQYQLVEPGTYIALSDRAYSSSWTPLPMNDAGTDGDEMGGDSIYSATLPAALQQHRRLIRYRITATDAENEIITAPYTDDPQPNFAYFCYDGIPAWQAAVQPGTTPLVQFSTNVMRRIPAVHLLSKNSDVENATWFERYTGDLYKWEGALVIDGTVYDHICYRMRGGVWRYAMTKNMWKFDANRGHDFQLRDDYGKKYGTKMTKLNLGACIQQGDDGHRGEQGMFESVGTRLFSLAGQEAFHTSFMQLRVIDNAAEATSDQYEGDFWGLYLAIEQPNGRFLDEHDLPDGNFYKMESGTGELNNLAPSGPDDKSDLNEILGSYTGASDDWWEAHWDLDAYYSYQTVVQAIHHYDINDNKNYFYYHNPDTGIWKVVPWDLDLTWADNMWQPSWGGLNTLASRILDAGSDGANLTLSGSTRPAFRMAFRNRIRELRDLLLNAEQAGQLIDEQASLLRDPGASPSFLDADRSMWDYNPKMNSDLYSSATFKAGTGKFYQWPYEPDVSNDFEGCVQLMKNYIDERGALLDALAADPDIPETPAIHYTGGNGYPINALAFQCASFSDPQGPSTFGAMQWRAGEILDPSAPAYEADEAPPYEIQPVWESGIISNFTAALTLPVDALKIGHAYRVRVRIMDTTGRWSHWSAPVEFITAESSNAGSLTQHLRISEVMHSPINGLEFIELYNSSADQTLVLDGAAFTEGIEFAFPEGTDLPPNSYLLLTDADDLNAFRTAVGLGPDIQLAGPYSGGLSGGGETIRLKTAPGGTTICEFTYNDSRFWPLAADGAGHSLVPLATAGPDDGALDDPANWRASAFIGGSPGTTDPAALPSLRLNEITAHTDYVDPEKAEYDSNDWIELYNASQATINLTNWYLSDNPSEPDKWPCPDLTVPPGGYLVFCEVDHFHSPITTGFGLDKAGEQVLLSFLPGTAADRVVDAIGFKGQENERSLSRRGAYWYATARSPETENTAPIEGLRITEIMAHPAPLGTNDNTRDEYIEIHNPTAEAIPLTTVGEAWRIDGGVEYTFPDNTVAAAGSTLLIVGFDPAETTTSNAFTAAYSIGNSVRLFGPWDGKLSNRGERIGLERPQAPDLPGDSYSWVVEDETVYGSCAPWPTTAGSGTSLTRILFSQSALDPNNWIAAAPTPGAIESNTTADLDADGQTDIEEVISGTDPRNPGSIFRADSRLNEGEITWESVPGRKYTILWTDDLKNPFVPIAENLHYPVSSYTDPRDASHKTGYYRIQVEQ